MLPHDAKCAVGDFDDQPLVQYLLDLQMLEFDRFDEVLNTFSRVHFKAE
jgi:hypothetical protein